mmetsp:Transcript_992/g.1597  ORF Transcript_992/g.1597 Transcript_992/m.1597 type:complete len:225 (-) Transcript_992:1386-2060(-)
MNTFLFFSSSSFVVAIYFVVAVVVDDDSEIDSSSLSRSCSFMKSILSSSSLLLPDFSAFGTTFRFPFTTTVVFDERMWKLLPMLLLLPLPRTVQRDAASSVTLKYPSSFIIISRTSCGQRMDAVRSARWRIANVMVFLSDEEPFLETFFSVLTLAEKLRPRGDFVEIAVDSAAPANVLLLLTQFEPPDFANTISRSSRACSVAESPCCDPSLFDKRSFLNLDLD